MPFVTSTQYPAIREVLDLSLTEAQLPDATIAAAPFHPAAEAEVARRLGDLAATAAGDPTANAAAQRAVMLFTAARLVIGMPVVNRRQLLDTTIGYAPETPTVRAARYRREGAAELAAVRLALDPTATTDDVLVPFTVAPGGRAYSDSGVVEGTALGL